MVLSFHHRTISWEDQLKNMEPELPYSIFFDAHALQEADEREHIREHEEQQNEVKSFYNTILNFLM